MKTAIAIPAFSRLPAINRCLASLSTNEEVASGSVDVLIYPDLSPPHELQEMQSIFAFHALRGGIQPPPPERLYGCRNILRAYHATFALGYDRVIRMDSDLTVSPYFIRLLLASLAATSTPTQSDIVCTLNYKDKLTHASHMRRGISTGTNLCLTSAHWSTASALATEYENQFLLPGPYLRDNHSASAWLLARAGRSVGPGHEGILWTAFNAANLLPWHFTVNRCIHLALDGENANPASSAIFQRVTLDHIPEDAHRTTFTYET